MKNKKRILIGCVVTAVWIAAALGAYFGIIRPWQAQKEWQRTVQEYREAKTAQYIRENEAFDDYEVEVAFLGDSLTDGYDLAKDYPQYITANRGIGGDTTFDLEGRLQVSVYDLKPQVAVMLIGANNPDTMLQNYESILQGLKENLPETKLVLLSMTAMGG